MKNLTDCYKLNNGIEIPCVGFGTWQTPDGDIARSSVKEAIMCGYRHIDTAAAYGNEESVGQGIKDSGVRRKDIFITTKLDNPVRGYNETIEAFETSIRNLGIDYLDMFLIHWPNPKKYRPNYEEMNAVSWKAMEDLYSSGKIRAIGVSNFHPKYMNTLLKTAKVIPAVNQIRLYPGFTLDDTVKNSRENGIFLEAYSPFGTGDIFQASELKSLSEKYNKTVAQVCLRWSLQKGFLPLPKSVTPSRIKENTDIFDFELSEKDMSALDNMPNYCGLGFDADNSNF